MKDERFMPILVGAGQFIDRSDSENGLTSVEIIARAVQASQKDTGCKPLFNSLDVLACSGLTVDARQVTTPVSGMVKNVPLAVAKAAGLQTKRTVYAEAGGNTPQMLVNHFAKAISQGQCETVLLAGGEALHTMNLRFNHWAKFLRPKGSWKDKSGPTPEAIGDPSDGSSAYENKYWMNLPANVYPLFENALRAYYGRSIDAHLDKICDLFAGIATVAANNEFAWFNKPPSKQEILEQSLSNRMVSFPYRKRLNSMIMVNQSAAVVMTSVARAKALGIPSDRWVYLHGYADGFETWNVSERVNYHSSPAIEQLTKSALTMASKSIDDIATFDLYSCFPSAVQIACDAMGIAHNDPRKLSLTGGLPYFGGPGNNYSMHAIAEMLTWARNNPTEFGLLNANGWYLTKHSIGIYSQQSPKVEFACTEHIKPTYTSAPKVNPDATGSATIETYTVLHDRRNRPRKAIVIARTLSGERCLATTNNRPETLQSLLAQEGVGRSGQLIKSFSRTLFEL